MPSTVPHLLLDEDGSEITVASFAPHVYWQPGETLVLGAGLRYRVLERREPAGDGDTVVLVLERM